MIDSVRTRIIVEANKCKLRAHPEAVIEGYHIWWCETHNRPWFECEKEIAIGIAEESEARLADISRVINEYARSS